MLRRAENVTAELERDLWGLLCGRRYRVHFRLGRKVWVLPGRMTIAEFQAREAASYSRPKPITEIGERVYWRYAGYWYWDNDRLSAEEVRALITMRSGSRSAHINRAKSYEALEQHPRQVRRSKVPDSVKLLVSKRDEGRCQRCGATSNLQYDHIIPVSRGGSSTEHNIQLLCAPCNMQKGANLV